LKKKGLLYRLKVEENVKKISMKHILLIICVFGGICLVPCGCGSERVADTDVENQLDDSIPDSGTDPNKPNDPNDPSNPDVPNDPNGTNEEPPLETAKKRTYYYRFKMDNLTVGTNAHADVSGARPSILWDEREKLGVYMGGENGAKLFENRQYSIEAADLGSIQVIDTLTTTSNKGQSYAYYPYQPGFGSSVSYTLSGIQDQSSDSCTKTVMSGNICRNIFMTSNLTDSFTLEGGTGEMTFRNVFALVKLQVSKKADFAAFGSQHIKRVRIYAANITDIEQPLSSYTLAGDYEINVSDAEAARPVFKNNSTGVITANVSGGGVISESSASDNPCVWFIVNPLVLDANERIVSVIETEDYRITTRHELSELKANCVYELSVQASRTGDGNSYTVSDTRIETMYSGASNCYIVPKAGLCAFPLKTVVSGSNLPEGELDWLWCAKSGGGSCSITELIDVSSFDIIEIAGAKYVRFRAGSRFGVYTPGNVLLALKNGNRILWTWHIWLTDDIEMTDNIPYGEKYIDASGREICFLDRNTGALSKAPNSSEKDRYGFVYQWGRKEPFYGGDGRTTEESNALSVAMDNTSINPSGWESNVNTWRAVTVQTVDYAARNPMTFIYNANSSLSEGTADWVNGALDVNLWRDDFKTDNDPCPYGYKVPDKQSMKVLHEAYAGNLSSTGFGYISSGKYWQYYSVPFTALWPSGGKRQGRVMGKLLPYDESITGEASKGVPSCYYWTSTARSNGGAFRLYTRDNALWSEDEYGDRADAYAVRCVKE